MKLKKEFYDWPFASESTSDISFSLVIKVTDMILSQKKIKQF